MATSMSVQTRQAVRAVPLGDRAEPTATVQTFTVDAPCVACGAPLGATLARATGAHAQYAVLESGRCDCAAGGAAQDDRFLAAGRPRLG